jgi:hypothetical protein
LEPPRSSNGYSLDWKLYQLDIKHGLFIDSIGAYARNSKTGRVIDLGRAGGNGGQSELVTIG